MFCPKCGKEIPDKATSCPECGAKFAKQKKPIFKRWWFWVIIVILVIGIIGAASGNKSQEDTTKDNSSTPVVASTDPVQEGQIGKYIVTIKDSKVTEDLSGNKILIVTYSFTNNNEEPKAFSYVIEDKLYQNGVQLGDVYSSYGIDDYDFDNQHKEIQQGISLDIQAAYELNDESSDVEVRISELFSLTDDTLTYTIKLN